MSSPLNFELLISDLTIPNYSGPIKCALVLANFSTTISFPCKPLNLVNLKVDNTEKLYLSVFTQSSEVGCLEIPYSAFSQGTLDQRYKLYENSISPEKERGQLKVTGEVHLLIKKLEDVCIRCEGLEKLVRNIKVDLDEIEDTVHTHAPNPHPAPVREEKKPVGIKKNKQQKVLRSSKNEASSAKQINPGASMNSMISANNSTMAPENSIDLKKMLEESYRARQELQLSVSETTDQLTLHLKEQREVLEQALSERSSAIDKMQELNEKIQKLDDEYQKLKIELEEKDAVMNNLISKLNSSENYEKSAKNLAQDLEKSVSDNEGLSKKLQDSILAFSTSNNALNKRIEDLTKEKAELLNRIEELVKENHKLKQENDRYLNLVNELCAQIALLQAEISTLKARENREKILAEALKNEEEANNKLKNDLDELSKKYLDQSNKFSKENSRLLQEKIAADNKNNNLLRDLEKKEKNIYNLSNELEKSQSDLAALEQHLCVTEDLNKIIDQLSKQNAEYERENEKMANQISNLNDRVESQEELLRNQAEKINELENNRLEREEQIANLEALLDELRKDREIYRPNKDDPIDIALSDYVNTRPAGLKVPFDREDHGIYNFGTKKIFVKLEQGKLLIRVGGGYMQVEDFVKLYSPVELERFSNAKKEQAQKIRQGYLGKYADSLTGQKNKNEMSPERAIKLMKDQMASGSYTPYYAVQLKSPERSVNKSPAASDRLSRGSFN